MSLELTASKDELRAAFFALQSREDVADLLEISDKQLIYHLYIAPDSRRYTTFRIPKKSSGVREISAPASALKIVQQKLNQVLQCVYEPKPAVHGFTLDKSIVSNAKIHAGRKYVFNVDLKDFFPSINFGRVRGLFVGFPYNRNSAVATVLAQICCFNTQLPQGAPTSPIVSNMICAKMDAQLQQLAKRYKCTYTRYADDITFSTTKPRFPSAIAGALETGEVEVGSELLSIIRGNGFEINERKVRLQMPHRRQEVTGLTTNIFPNVRRRYVREIRAMLHAAERYGLEAAQTKYESEYAPRHLGPRRPTPSFARVVQGKIEFLGMVRGRDNPLYLRLRDRLWKILPDFAKEQPAAITLPVPLVITEGKTDWKHIKTAYLKLKESGVINQHLEIDFLEYGDETPMGDGELQKLCAAHAKVPQARPEICIFDRDKPQVVNDVTSRDKDYKDWGNNVFSCAIPVPEHRPEARDISIEFYYQDKDIKRRDPNGRRLFLNNEFDPKTCRLLSSPEVFCTDRNRIRRPSVTIIDSESQVWNMSNENIALSKNDFADLIASGHENFRDIEFVEFRRIFELIEVILRDIALSQ